MTKTIKRLLPAALAVLLAGCAMQPVDSTTTRYRVALVAKNNRDSEFWDAVFTGAEAAATEYNLQLTITAPDDEEDYAAQPCEICACETIWARGSRVLELHAAVCGKFFVTECAIPAGRANGLTNSKKQVYFWMITNDKGELSWNRQRYTLPIFAVIRV